MDRAQAMIEPIRAIEDVELGRIVDAYWANIAAQPGFPWQEAFERILYYSLLYVLLHYYFRFPYPRLITVVLYYIDYYIYNATQLYLFVVLCAVVRRLWRNLLQYSREKLQKYSVTVDENGNVCEVEEYESYYMRNGGRVKVPAHQT